MTSPFAKPSDYAGASYFKPKEYMTSLALLIEPKSVEHDVPNEYRGKVTNRDEVVCDISVFEDQKQLEDGTPGNILKSCKVVHGMLTSTVSKIIGGAMVATVSEIATKNGSGYVFRDVDADTESKVADYFTARSAAADAAPSFD